ncbi:MAG: hypothetical protein Q9162_002009 [Coniocarpon cinnabarinum]
MLSLPLLLLPSLTYALPALVSRQNTCAPLHIIAARGSTEDPGAGPTLQPLITQIEQQIADADDVALDYPASLVDPIYGDSVHQGVENLGDLLDQVRSDCPQSKVALLGYSQGAQVILDTLCGTSEIGFLPTAPYTSDFASQLSSIAIFGDPTHIPGQPYDRGNGTHFGLFPRLNPGACDPFADKLRSYCNDGDPVCEDGLNIDEHIDEVYDRTSGPMAVQWVVSNYNGSPVGSGCLHIDAAGPLGELVSVSIMERDPQRTIISTPKCFEWERLEELETAVNDLLPTFPPKPSEGKKSTDHLRPLLEFADNQLESPPNFSERLNMCALGASTHQSLAVVLLEPAPSSQRMTPQELFQTPTIKCIDEMRQWCSGDVYNVENTAVLDVQSFLYNALEETKPLHNWYVTAKEHDENIEDAYAAFTKAIARLQPDVIVMCQCATRNAQNPLVSELSSSMDKIGELRAVRISGKDVLMVNGFHPSKFLERSYVENDTDMCPVLAEDSSMRRELQACRETALRRALQLAFAVAVNALSGCEVSGFGFTRL